MKVVHLFGHEPLFEMEFNERAVFISALQTFCANFPEDENAAAMLRTAEQIDMAELAMLRSEPSPEKDQTRIVKGGVCRGCGGPTTYTRQNSKSGLCFNCEHGGNPRGNPSGKPN